MKTEWRKCKKIKNDLAELKNKHTETNNTITEVKNTLEGISSRMSEAEEWISELEDKMVEIIAEEQNKVKRIEESVMDLWENIKCLVSRGSQGLRSPLESRRGSLGAP